jgi:hypothetical protein
MRKLKQSQSKQIVNINLDEVFCKNCGLNLIDIANYQYDGHSSSTSTALEEDCKCRCGALFILHYDLFDEEGHVYSKIFTGDINNLDYNWQDSLTEDQKIIISKHLEHCPICIDRLSEEELTDAWLRDFINTLRKREGYVV